MNLRETLVKLFTDAATDKPSRPSVKIIDGQWTLTIKGNRSKWEETIKEACIPSHASQTVEADCITLQWPSVADVIFGNGGLMSQSMQGYEVRAPQLHMARLIQRSIEMGEPAIIEAGTGTGKSFAYAAVCMYMGKRCVISTSNKALQAQLYQKDIPFLCKLFPGKKVALAQGKGNYLCRAKCQEQSAEAQIAAIDLSDVMSSLVNHLKEEGWKTEIQEDRELWFDTLRFIQKEVELAKSKAYQEAAKCKVTIDNYPVKEFYKITETGNTEEIEVHVSDINRWTADENCTGQRCTFYDSCFYYQAKAERQSADVVVCNHALLILDRLYPYASILPGCDVVVIDEAHQLTNYARNALGHEFTLPSIQKALDDAREWVKEENFTRTAEAERLLSEFWRDIDTLCIGKEGRQPVGVERKEVFESGQNLATEMHGIADLIWDLEDTPEDDEQVKRQRKANKLRNLADKICAASSPTIENHVRWIEPEAHNLVNVPFVVSDFIGRMAGFEATQESIADTTRCTRCKRALTNIVYVLDGKGYGPDCVRHVDLFGDAEPVDLTTWSNQPVETRKTHHSPTAIVFTSATIAAPDLGHFMRECGLSHGFQMVVDSPFDYANNALLYVPNGETPPPSDATWPVWAAHEMRDLVLSAGGGAFLLFTSYKNMTDTLKLIQHSLTSAGLKVFVQGKLPKGEIAKQFRKDGNAVLFATKSFWEGISIEGAALRLVVIDKMPFQAPSPLLKARETTVNNAFADLHVPEMIIDLKQGAGRLIRRMDDWGVIALLDSRARLKPYGRQMVLPAMPPAKLTSSRAEVNEFFIAKKLPETISKLSLDFPVDIDKTAWDELDELGF